MHCAAARSSTTSHQQQASIMPAAPPPPPTCEEAQPRLLLHHRHLDVLAAALHHLGQREGGARVHATRRQRAGERNYGMR